MNDSDRPESFRFDNGYGTVIRVHAESWEVDIASADGGVIPNAFVLGPRLPEVSTPERPQFVVFGYNWHLQGQAWCVPVSSRLSSVRFPRAEFLYYDEVENFRITISRDGVLEIRNAKGPLLQIRILEEDGVIRLDTPTTHVALKDADGSIQAQCDGDLTAEAGGNIAAEAGGDIEATAGGNIALEAGGNIDITAGGIVTITGTMIKLNE